MPEEPVGSYDVAKIAYVDRKIASGGIHEGRPSPSVRGDSSLPLEWITIGTHNAYYVKYCTKV